MKQKVKGILLGVLVFVLAFGGGMSLGSKLADIGFMAIVFLVVFAVLSVFLAIQLHEIGHFIFGKLAGYSLIMLKVGSLCWKYENGKYKFAFEKKTKGFNGLCMMLPPEHDVSEKSNLLYYSGGIIMNLFTGLLALSLAIIFPFWHPYLLIGLWAFGALSTILGLINLYPRIVQNNPTDGKIIWGIIRKDDFAKDMVYINAIQQQVVLGTRPADIAYLNGPLREETSPRQFYIYILIYHLYNAMDRQDMEKMRYILERMEMSEGSIPTAVEAPVKYEMCGAYCLLGDKDKARSYMDEDIRAQLEKEDDLNGNRVKAYIAYYLQEDKEQATAYCERGLAVTDTFPLKGQIFMEVDLISRLKNEMGASL